MMIRTVQDIPEEIKNIIERFYMTDADSAIQASHTLLRANPELSKLLGVVEQIIKNPPDSIFLFYDELISRVNDESFDKAEEKADESKELDSEELGENLFDLFSENADVPSNEDELFTQLSDSLESDRKVMTEDSKQVSDGFNSLLRDVVSQRKKENTDEPCIKSGNFESNLNRALSNGEEGISSDISLDIDVDLDFDLNNDFPDIFNKEGENETKAGRDDETVASYDDIRADEKADPSQETMAVHAFEKRANSGEVDKELVIEKTLEDEPVSEAVNDMPFGEIDISLSGDVEALDADAVDDDLHLDLPVLNMDDVLSDGKEIVDSPTITPFGDNNPVEIPKGASKSSLPEHILEDEIRGSSRVPNLPPSLGSTDTTPIPKRRYGGSFMTINDETPGVDKVTSPKLSPIDEGDQPRRNRAPTMGGFRTGEYINSDIVSRPTVTNLTPVAPAGMGLGLPPVSAPASNGLKSVAAGIQSIAKPLSPAGSGLQPVAKVLSPIPRKVSSDTNKQATDVLGVTRNPSLYEKAKPTSIALSPVIPTGLKPLSSSGDNGALTRLRPLTRTPKLRCSMSDISQHNAMNPRAGFLISLIDGHTSISDILDISAWPENDTAELLLELEAQKIIEFK